MMVMVRMWVRRLVERRCVGCLMLPSSHSWLYMRYGGYVHDEDFNVVDGFFQLGGWTNICICTRP